MRKIVFADDDTSLRSATEIILSKAGYDVYLALNGVQAVALCEAVRPDVVILDVMMPGMDGFEACSQIREFSPDVPIIILSACGAIGDKRSGFGSGADDYMTKPFNGEELLLRIEALLRRSAKKGERGQETDAQETLCIDELVVDLYSCKVSVRGKPANLTPTEFKIVARMAKQPGRVFTREDLIDDIWGEEYRNDGISIPTYIRRIRKKIEREPSSPEYLHTVWNLGYKLGE